MKYKDDINIKSEDIERYIDEYISDPIKVAMTSAFSRSSLEDVLFIPEKANRLKFTFNIDIPTMRAVSQQQTGRCWIYAATNVLREVIAKKLNISSFEVSQSYIAFWDKMEKCNQFFNWIISTAEYSINDRFVNYILKQGIIDGGDWYNFSFIVDKYGIIPKDAMLDTYQSCCTEQLNSYINMYCRIVAKKLRILCNENKFRLVYELKDKALSKIFSFLVQCYGFPPSDFNYEYTNKLNEKVRISNCNPIKFKETYLGDIVDDFVYILNMPSLNMPFNKRYTVKYKNLKDNNIYLNLCRSDFEGMVLEQLKNGLPVDFACDWKMFCDKSKLHIWDEESFNFKFMTGFDEEIGKSDMLDYCISKSNHEMVFTGVNLIKDKPNRWKIENSWGSQGIHGGYFIASDSWVQKYVYKAVIRKEYLDKLIQSIPNEVTELEPWNLL